MSKTEAQIQIAKAVEALASVERVAAWNDRHYINLAASKGSRCNGDLRTKIWLRGPLLTIETGKGYLSEAFAAGKAEVVAAVEAAGGSVRVI